MVRKLVLAFTGLGVASAVAIYLFTIPLLRRLPKPSRVSVDGITTIDEAVEACRRTQLHGWDLVAYAQNLAARKFTYSRLNTWDTPSRAFERGMGYCEQQLLALKRIWSAPASLEAPMLADLPTEYQMQALYSTLPQTFSEAYHRRTSAAFPHCTSTPSQP